MARRALIGLAIGVVAFGLAAALGATTKLREFEDLSYDWRLAETPGRPDIAIVEIDENSLRLLAPFFGRWPWPRFVHASAIDFLVRAHAKLIVYDVLFTERDDRGSFSVGNGTMTGAQSDQALVDSVKRAGNVLLVGDATFEGDPNKALPPPPALPGPSYSPGPGFEPQPWFNPPFEELDKAALAVGHDRMRRDSGSGVVRRMLPFIDAGGVDVPALGLAAAMASGPTPPADVKLDGDRLRVGPAQMPLLSEPIVVSTRRPGSDDSAPPIQEVRPSKQALIDFRGGGKAYPTFPFVNVLKAEDQIESGRDPTLPLDTFRDKIVFIGTSAAGLADIHVTPFGSSPGVGIHAAIADDVLSNRFMRRASPVTNLTVAAAAGLAAGVLATLLPAGWATGAVLLLGLALAGLLTHEVRAGLWIDALAPLSAMALALFGGVGWQYFIEGREKRKVKQLFGRYVSRDVYHALLADPGRARLGGQRRDMTVLFSDIRGFTTKSEAHAAESIVEQLNEYFEEMVEILFRHQGTLDKFVGDMVMGLFGAPIEDPKHPDHAVETALEMLAALKALNARWTAAGRPALDIGVGISTGEMIAGNIGSERIMAYTVIGDAVNLGSRLESLNKTYGTHILISQATKDRLTIPVETKLVGEVTVKGKTKAVTVYQVVTDSDTTKTETAH